MRFHRIPEGWASPCGHAIIYDNGGGVGPARGSGRWALTIDDEWLANIDTLAQAKDRAERELAYLDLQQRRA